MTIFKRFVEPGRLAIGRFGDIFDKPVVIVDVISFTRVLIDGPGINRQVVTVRRLALTDQKVDISRGASTDELNAALKQNDVIAEWKSTHWGKKRSLHHRKRELTDFERFKLVQARSAIANAQ